MSQTPLTLNNYVRDAFEEVMANHTTAFLANGRQPEWIEEWPEEVYTCILGFHSDEMNGSLVICADEPMLKATCPTDIEDGDKESNLRDWMGELGNLLVGRVKANMLKHDISLQLNPPSVTLSTPMIMDSYAERNPSGPFWFLVEDHRCCIQFGADYQGAEIDLTNTKNSGEIGAGGAILDMNPVAKRPLDLAPQEAASGLQSQNTGPAVAPNLGASYQHADNGLFAEIADMRFEQRRFTIWFASGYQLRCHYDEMPVAPKGIFVGDSTIAFTKETGGVTVSFGDFEFYIPLPEGRLRAAS